MRKPRHFKRDGRRDANEPAIVSVLEQIGCTVELLDVIDLLVGFQGENWLLEVKTEAGKLNENQRPWHDKWRGQKAVVRTPDEALDVILRRKGQHGTKR